MKFDYDGAYHTRVYCLNHGSMLIKAEGRTKRHDPRCPIGGCWLNDGSPLPTTEQYLKSMGCST